MIVKEEHYRYEHGRVSNVKTLENLINVSVPALGIEELALSLLNLFFVEIFPDLKN